MMSYVGFPAYYEPVTMIDYAHGAHVLPEGEEDRFLPAENRDYFSKGITQTHTYYNIDCIPLI